MEAWAHRTNTQIDTDTSIPAVPTRLPDPSHAGEGRERERESARARQAKPSQETPPPKPPRFQNPSDGRSLIRPQTHPPASR